MILIEIYMNTLLNTPNIEAKVSFLNNKISTENKSKFGILKVINQTNELYFNNIHWVFTIDKSGSMNDKCNDDKTKMEHIFQVLTNMFNYFVDLSEKNNIQQYITIIGFNHTNDIICCDRLIDKSILTFLDTVKKRLEPGGMTNIDNALNAVIENIQTIQPTQKTETTQNTQLIQTTENTQIVNIFMSDGEITCGESSANILKNKLESINYNHVFIGYGDKHDTKLMKSLAEHPRGEYYFIESFENAGMVYGEIIHSSLYECIKDISIKAENGKIYDYKNDSWVSELNISTLVSNKERVWHIQKDSNDEFKINISYTDISSQHKSTRSCNNNTLTSIAKVVSSVLLQEETKKNTPITTINMKTINKTITATNHYPDTDIDKDVEKYWWRQRTQEYMNMVNKYINAQQTQQTQQTHENILTRTTSTKNVLNIEQKTTGNLLLDAAKGGTWDIVLLILDKYPELINTIPYPRKFGVIHHAIYQNNIDIFEELIKRNANIEIKTSDNKNCLNLAIECKHNILVNKIKDVLTNLQRQNSNKVLAVKKEEIVNNLNKFMGNIKTYMKANNLEEDQFMKELCDDIYISIHSLYSTHGNMFMEARISSQGNQRAYCIQNLDSLTTSKNSSLNHTLSRSTSSVYASCNELIVMRSCSKPEVITPSQSSPQKQPTLQRSTSLSTSPPSYKSI